jgi:hypothetical protein
MKQRIVAAALAYRQRTGQTADTWWVPKNQQGAVLELLERAAREGRRVTEAELIAAKGSRTILQGLSAKP